jgi:hypothetical protein
MYWTSSGGMQQKLSSVLGRSQHRHEMFCDKNLSHTKFNKSVELKHAAVSSQSVHVAACVPDHYRFIGSPHNEQLQAQS